MRARINESEDLRIKANRVIFAIPSHIPNAQVDRYVVKLNFKPRDRWTRYLADVAIKRQEEKNVKSSMRIKVCSL